MLLAHTQLYDDVSTDEPSGSKHRGNDAAEGRPSPGANLRLRAQVTLQEFSVSVGCSVITLGALYCITHKPNCSAKILKRVCQTVQQNFQMEVIFGGS